MNGYRSPAGANRREFLRQVVGASVLAWPALARGREYPGRAVAPRRVAKSAIMLWMGGGPATIDMWDMKPGAATGGPFRPIATSGEVQICEHLPRVARQMHHLAIIRSMNTVDADHARGHYRMHTGYVPEPNEQHPSYGAVISHHADERARAAELMTRQWNAALDFEREPARLRQRYGDTAFGRRCLAARRLVEQDVPFVEVRMGGWDTHAGNFATLKAKLPQLDQALSALVGDLDERGMLRETVIVWLGEFGRTPRINVDAGRDHWARSWSCVVGGGPLRGGVAVGETSADGTRVETQPYSAQDLMATVCHAMGIPLSIPLTTPSGTAVKIANGGRPIPELFG